MMIKPKYRTLFSAKRKRRPVPKGPDKELIDVVVAMKQRNPTWGCRRIAQQISLAFARRYRQRRCTQDSCSAFSAKDGFIGSILAYKIELSLLYFALTICRCAEESYQPE
jgi:hypothetical protein